MKRFILLAIRLARAGRRRPSLYEDMEQGAVTGFCAATGLALLAPGSLSAPLLILFSSLGLMAGGVIGVILWIGSAPLPEEPVLAPAPGQARGRVAVRKAGSPTTRSGHRRRPGPPFS